MTATPPRRSWFSQPPPAFNVAATLVALVAAVGLAWMAWRYYADTPWTRDGRVRAYTVQVAPEVSGTVVRLHVQDNQFVRRGDVLFEIDPGTFENAVTQAQGSLDAAKAQASYLAGTAARTAALSDRATTAHQKHPTGGQAQAASATTIQMQGTLAQAQLNLKRTTLRASVDGWVTNLLLQEGSFAMTGQPALTLVNADSFWVEGYFEETQLPRIAVGDAARVSLMAWPNLPIEGRVASLGRGISVGDAAPGVQGLPSVNPVFTWVRLSQRVPVRVELDDVPCPITLFSGMTANVAILAVKAQPRVSGEPTVRRGFEATVPCGQTLAKVRP